MDIGKLINTVIAWGLALAAIGELPAATRFVMKEAARSHQMGLVSLGAFNRQLQSGGKLSAPKHSQNSKNRNINSDFGN